jgi:hypothetical protein
VQEDRVSGTARTGRGRACRAMCLCMSSRAPGFNGPTV